MKQSTHRRTRRRRRSPSLPELEQAMAAVLNTLASLQSRRSYRRAMEEFISWYCSEPRLALNRSVVLRYRLRLENMRLAASTINVRLAAVRRLATEAADSGLLSPDLIAGIRRVRGVKQLGRRMGNWLTAEEGHRLISAVSTVTPRGKRDAAMLGLLIGCGLRRTELVELDVDQIQQREQRWVIVDLIGKGGRVRTVPMPGWVKEALDDWVCSAEITEGRLFRAIRKNGVLWGCGLTQNVVWYVVKQCARRAGIQKLSPHDLRRSCARLCVLLSQQRTAITPRSRPAEVTSLPDRSLNLEAARPRLRCRDRHDRRRQDRPGVQKKECPRTGHVSRRCSHTFCICRQSVSATSPARSTPWIWPQPSNTIPRHRRWRGRRWRWPIWFAPPGKASWCGVASGFGDRT